MSLRRDIHSAFEVITPPLGGMPERVVQTVLAEPKARRRKERILLRLRTPLSLVAVFLLIAVVVAAVIGGRLIRDWNAHYNLAPSGEANLSPLEKLEARPLQVPGIKSAAQCIQGPLDSKGDLGQGPAHISGSAVETPTNAATYFHDVLLVDRPIAGPVLVRAIDPITRHSLVFVGDYAGGPTVGTDVLSGQTVEQHVELVVPDASQPPLAWQFIAGVPKGLSPCEVWQLDGAGFTEVVVKYVAN